MKLSQRHKCDGPLYTFPAMVATVLTKGFFRKIYLNNTKQVPLDAPVILAVNHPLAFMDPILLGCYLDTPLYFMTRGDVFEKPFYRKLMESVNMFPVYRRRDGYNHRDRNDGVFEYVQEKLKQKKVVCIFVEGEHHLEKRVNPVQKGIARIAFQTYEKDQLDDLQILPVGCNYQSGKCMRDDTMINVGLPIFIKEYWDLYQQNQALAIKKLCDDIYSRLLELCYHINEPADDLLGEQMLDRYRAEQKVPLLPAVENNTGWFQGEKAVLEKLNNLSDEQKASLQANNAAYQQALSQLPFRDDAFMHPEWARWNLVFLFVLGFIPWILGAISLAPLLWLSKWVTAKTVRKIEYETSVMLGVALLAGILYFTLLLLIALLLASPWLIGLVILLPLLGWWSMLYPEWWTRWRESRKALRHPQREELQALRAKARQF